MKNTKIVSMMVITLLFVFTFEVKAADFRNVSWGMKIEQVKSIETSEFVEMSKPNNGSQGLMYNIEKSGNLYYYFTNNKLTHASSIVILVNGADADNYYNEQKIILTKKHGTMTNEIIEYAGNMAIWETKYRIIQLAVTDNGPEQLIGIIMDNEK